jgi:hypothetical protein
MQEPRDIKPEFVEIAKFLHQAYQSMDLLFGPLKKSGGKAGGGGNFGQMLKKPELLVKTKKFNTMEMEMDKFLAKKQKIFTNNDI